MQIYLHHDGQQLGPFTEAEVRAQLGAGSLSLQDHVWWEGQAAWIPLGQSPFALTPAAPPVYLPPVPAPGRPGIPSSALTAPATSALAMWSLVCGLFSLLCSLFTAIPAVILGHMALSEMKKNPALKGSGMALAGLIIGYLFLGLFVIFMISIVLLQSMGSQVKDMFKQINQQMTSAQGNASPDDSTNSADDNSNTNSAPVVNP